MKVFLKDPARQGPDLLAALHALADSTGRDTVALDGDGLAALIEQQGAGVPVGIHDGILVREISHDHAKSYTKNGCLNGHPPPLKGSAIHRPLPESGMEQRANKEQTEIEPRANREKVPKMAP